MKLKTQKRICVILFCVLLICSVQPSVFAADMKDSFSELTPVLKREAYNAVEGILTGALTVIEKSVPDRLETFDPEKFESQNFFKGTEPFLKTPANDAKWSLGYAQASLVPNDWKTHDYYLGGFIAIENQFSNHVEEIIDDMRVRVIAVCDGSDRGVSLFGTIDAIGVSNKDIRAIRATVSQAAQEMDIKLSSVNVSSTHCHSCIDTQGLWTDTFKKALNNIFAAFTRFGKIKSGADEAYLSFLRQTVADAMIRALSDMTTGSLTYAKKDIGKAYFNNKNRKSASALPTDLNRFMFTPDDPTICPTVIANLGAHPDVAGLPTETNSGRALSGDYVYYIGNELEKHGYNFMFFNGAIAGIYIGSGPSNDGLDLEHRYQTSERYGREIAKMLLAMTMTEEEIKSSSLYEEEVIKKEMAASKGYSLWCENWIPVTEQVLAPFLNVRLKEVRVTVTNPLILLAGKLKLANYDILKDKNRRYSINTEIGYLSLGGIPVVLVPGELVTDLFAGGNSLNKAGAVNECDFGHPSLKELFGENALCFGLMNDAIGYIVPDNDYKFVIFDDHYQEIISLGSGTASTLMTAFEALAKEVN